MFNEQDLPEPMRKFFEEMKEDFSVNDSSMSELQIESWKKFLELQIYIMKRYQKFLDNRLTQDPEKDVMSQMVKSCMSTYIDFMRFSRENRKKVLEMQRDIMQKNLKFFEKYLERINDKNN